MLRNESRSVPEGSIQLSISRLKICFHRQYDLGRSSVKSRFLSIPEAIAGAFFAELVSAVVFLFTSEPESLLVDGIPDAGLVAHIVLTLAFAVCAVIAYGYKWHCARMNQHDSDARDRAADEEIHSLLTGNRFRVSSDLYPEIYSQDYNDGGYHGYDLYD